MCVLYSLADFTLTRNKTDQEKYYTIPRNSEIGNVYKAVLQAKRPASTAGRFCPCSSCLNKVMKSPKTLEVDTIQLLKYIMNYLRLVLSYNR